MNSKQRGSNVEQILLDIGSHYDEICRIAQSAIHSATNLALFVHHEHTLKYLIEEARSLVSCFPMFTFTSTRFANQTSAIKVLAEFEIIRANTVASFRSKLSKADIRIYTYLFKKISNKELFNSPRNYQKKKVSEMSCSEESEISHLSCALESLQSRMLKLKELGTETLQDEVYFREESCLPIRDETRSIDLSYFPAKYAKNKDLYIQRLLKDVDRLQNMISFYIYEHSIELDKVQNSCEQLISYYKNNSYRSKMNCCCSSFSFSSSTSTNCGSISSQSTDSDKSCFSFCNRETADVSIKVPDLPNRHISKHPPICQLETASFMRPSSRETSYRQASTFRIGDARILQIIDRSTESKRCIQTPKTPDIVYRKLPLEHDK
eukprot:GHVL01040671.1.p1 GENE.GHVL01040671.1~~GHVL01040671.1.p1  ORF type:complete len:379 (+),score=47.80 GHVL01040671.1:39-1175(+)